MPKWYQFTFNESLEGWTVETGTWGSVWTGTNGVKGSRLVKIGTYHTEYVLVKMSYSINITLGDKRFIVVVPFKLWRSSTTYYAESIYYGKLVVRLLKAGTEVASKTMTTPTYHFNDKDYHAHIFAPAIVFEPPIDADQVEIVLSVYISTNVGDDAYFGMETDNIAFYIEPDVIYRARLAATVQKEVAYTFSVSITGSKFAVIGTVDNAGLAKYVFKITYDSNVLQFTGSGRTTVITFTTISQFEWDLQSTQDLKQERRSDDWFIVVLDDAWIPSKLVEVTSIISASPLDPETTVLGYTGDPGTITLQTSRTCKMYDCECEFAPSAEFTQGTVDDIDSGTVTLVYKDSAGNVIDQQTLDLKTNTVDKTVRITKEYLEQGITIEETWTVVVSKIVTIEIALNMTLKLYVPG